MSGVNLFIFNHSPYQAQISAEGLDALFAFAAFEQPVKALFVGDGVFQLLSKQRPTHTRNLEKMLQAFELYDIPAAYVCADSLKARGLLVNAIGMPVEVIEAEAISALINNATHCFSF